MKTRPQISDRSRIYHILLVVTFCSHPVQLAVSDHNHGTSHRLYIGFTAVTAKLPYRFSSSGILSGLQVTVNRNTINEAMILQRVVIAVLYGKQMQSAHQLELCQQFSVQLDKESTKW